MIYTLYFSALYSSAEQDKIDLCSLTFYRDAVDFYRKNGSENERKKIIRGIGLLATKIVEYDELLEVMRIWESEKPLIGLREIMDGPKPKPNLTAEFKNEVNNILETTKAKIDERRNNELNLLRGKNEANKNLADSFIAANIHHQSTPLLIKIDFSNILFKIKFDKNETTKRTVEKILNQISERELLSKSNDKDFTTIALILFKTGWVINIGTFSEWLGLFSAAFNREKPTYKPYGVKDNINSIEIKFPFLAPPLLSK